MLELFGCITNLDACAASIINSIPIGYYIGGAFFLGMIVGAVFRWGGIAAFAIGVIAAKFGSRRFHEPIQTELPFPDGLPTQRKPRKRLLNRK